ncbi:MAG: hypothetical protein JWR18_2675, partial [Segetibacter sp.]|nr:hypothetical protein [Segetibacter sp.]
PRRACRYGRDTSTAEITEDANYPYSLRFTKRQKDGFIYVMDDDLNKFDSAARPGYYGAFGFLRRQNCGIEHVSAKEEEM